MVYVRVSVWPWSIRLFDEYRFTDVIAAFAAIVFVDIRLDTPAVNGVLSITFPYTLSAPLSSFVYQVPVGRVNEYEFVVNVHPVYITLVMTLVDMVFTTMKL